MAPNLLVTGPPRSGKTTVLVRVRERLASRNYRAGGVYCPEVREADDRVGFEIVDLLSGESRLLAHVGFEEGPTVGKYRVAVSNVEVVCGDAFSRAFDTADFLVVDEIAPMQLHSGTFVRRVRRALDSELPVLAAVHYRSTDGFVREVKSRTDCERFEVTPDTRDTLPDVLTDRLAAAL